MKRPFNSKKAGRKSRSENPRLNFLSEVMEDRWEPQIDVAETPESIVVIAEIAGVKPDNVHVDVDGRELRLHGERGTPAPNADTFPAEIPEGTFERKVTLPAETDPSRKSVTLREGLLRVVLPKLA